MAGPATISSTVAASPVAPAAKRMTLNGVVISERSLQRANQTGGVPYPQGGVIEIDVAWLEAESRRAYAATVQVDAARLATFGGRGDHGRLDVLLGPGADVTVTTPAQSELDRAASNAPIDTTTPVAAATTLVATCARRLSGSDPRVADLAAGIEDFALRRVLRNRDAFLARNPRPASRCGD